MSIMYVAAKTSGKLFPSGQRPLPIIDTLTRIFCFILFLSENLELSLAQSLLLVFWYRTEISRSTQSIMGQQVFWGFLQWRHKCLLSYDKIPHNPVLLHKIICSPESWKVKGQPHGDLIMFWCSINRTSSVHHVRQDTHGCKLHLVGGGIQLCGCCHLVQNTAGWARNALVNTWLVGGGRTSRNKTQEFILPGRFLKR